MIYFMYNDNNVGINKIYYILGLKKWLGCTIE